MSNNRQSRRYKVAGSVVLLLGIIGAGVVYWLGTRSPDLSGDPAMSGYFKAETRQMGRLYGEEGLLFEDLRNSLKEPGIQAVLILVGSVVVAGGCFVLAKFPAIEDKHDDSKLG